MAVHEEHHHAQAKGRGAPQRQPHTNHLPVLTKSGGRQTQNRTDNRPGNRNRSQLTFILPSDNQAGDHHVELQFGFASVRPDPRYPHAGAASSC